MADMICEECGRDCSKYKPEDFSGLCIECEAEDQGQLDEMQEAHEALDDAYEDHLEDITRSGRGSPIELLCARAGEMPQWIDTKQIGYQGGGIMGRRDTTHQNATEPRIPVRSYEQALREVRGKSVEDLLGQATRRLSAKPEEVGESEGEKLDAQIDATMAHAGAQCPNCGSPDLQVVELTNGDSYFECMACAFFASEVTGTEGGPTAWLIEDGEHTLPCCSNLCAKVGAARVGGRVVGERPWGNPESLCFACEQPLEG